MSTQRPVVSIVVPTHNEGEWLIRTINSINSTRAGVDYEIIVVDDCSTDGSTEAARGMERVRVIRPCMEPTGCVVARNRGAAVSEGEYLCFVDSHVLVIEDWLSRLVSTSQVYRDSALVSGNIYSSDKTDDPEVTRQQYAYSLKNWLTASHWYYYGENKFEAPYQTPLCPAGLMLTHRDHFNRLGGFSELIRRWGGTDVEISMKNYFYGGVNVVNPDVWIYHYFKNTGDRKPTFSVSYRETFFNRLLIAKIFTNPSVYEKTKAVLSRKSSLDAIERGLNDPEVVLGVEAIRSGFRRSWDDFQVDFQRELAQCFPDM